MSTVFIALVLAGTPHAHHDVALVDDRVVVDTRWAPGAWASAPPELALALPLPADAAIEGATAVRDDDDRIVGLVLDGDHVRTSVPLSTVQHDRTLPIPVVDDDEAVQRVSIDGALGFRPDAELELVTHLGYHVATALDHAERRAIDRQLRPAAIGSYYATTSAIVRAHGLHGELELRADVRRRSAVAVGVIFVLVCITGVVAYRRTRRGAEAERAEQVLAAEFDGLERDGT